MYGYLNERAMRARRRRRQNCASTLLILLYLALIPLAHSGPLVLEETAKLTTPDLATYSAAPVAIDGDFAIVTASKPTPPPDRSVDQVAVLFGRQSDGTWQYVRTLLHKVFFPLRGGETAVAMKDGVAAVVMAHQIHIFERTATGWVESASPGTAVNRAVEIDAGSIVVCDRINVAVIRKNAAGEWVFVATAPSPDGSLCSSQASLVGDLDISGTSLIVGAPDAVGHANIYEGPIGAWTASVLTGPPASLGWFGRYVTLENDTAVVSGAPTAGLHVFRRVSPGLWAQQPSLGSPDRLMTGGTGSFYLRGGRVYAGYSEDGARGTRAGSVMVFGRSANGAFVPVVKLMASDAHLYVSEPSGLALGRWVNASNRTVIASGWGTRGAYLFELPERLTQPSRLQDDFQDGNAATWTPIAGSAFAVAPTSTSLVYRQSSLAGNAASFLTNMDWTNQSIEADVRPTAFAAGGERWFGLAVRRADANNFYFLTVRNSNVVQIRRALNGSRTILASAPMPVVLNQTYRVRLEAVGTWLRAYVDGKLLAEARDSSLAGGAAGVAMYRTRADYDNVIVSPHPALTLFADDFQQSFSVHWRPGGNSLWNGGGFFEQRSVIGDASAVTGVTTDDQIVQARAQAVRFAPGGERWFGLMARYRDERNYYYVTVRNTNVISLRKVVNGAITVLDTAPLAVSAGTWYTLRLEAIGNALRVHVDGWPLLEAADSSFPRGRYGAVMYKTGARYDDFIAWQP